MVQRTRARNPKLTALLLQQQQQQPPAAAAVHWNVSSQKDKPEFPLQTNSSSCTCPGRSSQKPPTIWTLSRDWSPAGGGRYAEYASGTSPYRTNGRERETSDRVLDDVIPFNKPCTPGGYRQYAFGCDEIYGPNQTGDQSLGRHLVSLSSIPWILLWIMNMCTTISSRPAGSTPPSVTTRVQSLRL
jgi:hypothetical protein